MASRNLKPINGHLTKLDHLSISDIIGRPAEQKTVLKMPVFEEDLQKQRTPHIAMMHSVVKVEKK